MNSYDHRRGLYPLALTVAVGNWRVLAAAFAVIVAGNWGTHLVEHAWGADSVQSVVALIGSFATSFVAMVLINFTVVPGLLGEGSVRGWEALGTASVHRIALHFAASVMLLLMVALIMSGVTILGIGIFAAADDAVALVVLLTGGYALAMLLVTVCFGLLLPDVIAAGRFLPGQAWRWGRQNFRRLLGLLAAAMLPTTVTILYLEGMFDPQAYSEAESAAGTTGIDAETYLWTCVTGLISVAESVLAITALCKVYFAVAPAEEQVGNRRVAEVFD